MKYINLPQGKKAIVDDEDYPYLNRFKWVLSSKESNNLRAIRKIKVGAKNVTLAMERFIIDVEESDHVILHKNGDTLDNRKDNLIAGYFGMKNHRGAKFKTQHGKKCTSIYKGVYKESKGNLWRAVICTRERTEKGNRKQKKIGSFKTEREAALAYNEEAKELYGEYAYQNIIEEDYDNLGAILDKAKE